KGLLIRIDAKGETRVLYDADAEELRAIAVFADGAIAVGTSRGQAGRPAAGAAAGGSAPRGGGAARAGSGESPFAIEVTPSGGGKSGGFLVQTHGSGRIPPPPPADFVYSIAVADSHTVWVATGEPGAVFRVGRNKKF